MTGLPKRFLLGANYWSRAGGPRMWERFDEQAVRVELAELRAIGLDCLRAFAFIPSFMPEPPAVVPEMIERFARFARLAEAAELSLLPTALVGHMSGENFDFRGQAGRSLYRDPELLAWQAVLLRALATALADSPAVIGWVLSNEMPLWATPPGTALGDPAEIVAWCRTLTEALRAVDRRPIGTGDGCMSGWPTRKTAPLVDWVAPHVYYGDIDPLRQAWHTDLQLRAAQAIGKPVLLEEFGGSANQAGELEHAAYVREMVLAALGCGAAGALVWCASDFDESSLGHEVPYEHHAFELGFGLLRADGSEKPVCDELRALRRLLDGIDFTHVARPAGRAALVQPDYLERQFPFSWEDRGALKKALVQAYVLACQAGLDPDVVSEDDDLGGYALILCPATQKLRVPTWHKLEAAARAGATVYWSYHSGDYEFHQGMWCPNFERLTGLRHRLRYGCFDLPGDRVTFKGQLVLSVPTGESRSNGPQTLARLPIEPLSGVPVESLAVDGEGRLALAEHRLGAGRVIFFAYPLERYLAQLADGSSRGAHHLYRLLGDEADVEPRYPTRHFDVQSRVLEDGADDLVIVQHRGWTATVDDATELPREAELLYDRGNPGAGVFGPKGARVYRVRKVR
jgi:endo-1,4-beta-mannosidase